jgi:hypothetical protein
MACRSSPRDVVRALSSSRPFRIGQSPGIIFLVVRPVKMIRNDPAVFHAHFLQGRKVHLRKTVCQGQAWVHQRRPLAVGTRRLSSCRCGRRLALRVRTSQRRCQQPVDRAVDGGEIAVFDTALVSRFRVAARASERRDGHAADALANPCRCGRASLVSWSLLSGRGARISVGSHALNRTSTGSRRHQSALTEKAVRLCAAPSSPAMPRALARRFG